MLRLGKRHAQLQDKLWNVTSLTYEVGCQLASYRLPYEATVLPPGHPELAHENEITERRVKAWREQNKHRQSVKPVRPKWLREAEIEFRNARIDWIEPPVEAYSNRNYCQLSLDPLREANCPAYRALTAREKYNHYYLQRKYPATTMKQKRRVFILTRSITRLAYESPVVGKFPCIMPHQKYWIDYLDRILVPSEKLATQGFFHGSVDLSNMTRWEVSMLAGNAVGVTVCQAIQFSLQHEFGDVL